MSEVPTRLSPRDHGKENPRLLYAAKPTLRPALLVRGSSRRNMTMRGARALSANISMSNRREFLSDSAWSVPPTKGVLT